MKDLLSWTLETIRNDDTMMSWLEERRYEWAPIVGSALSKILEGQSVLLLADEQNRWFEEYIVRRINRPGMSRPLLPFFSFEAVYPHVDAIRTDQDIDLLFDMLSLSYPQGCFFWYIGKADHPRARIAFRNDESLLWVMDEEMTNSFTLRSYDEMIDIKLLQLFRLFDKTLSAALFAEVDTGG
ncbi:HobA family DNA replication regulator [Hydrogenimonas urashimensis]|uniref:HobA family DNA replication regulator n=1 Tax=Hydrogenimonas urashimensis TaxID=2740515 RepID=UPI001F198B65|nr:HobA family DNA replication regulator [Hydrogenimonas urashimensis]